MRQRSINAQLREKILALDSTGLRIEFFRPDEGMRVYHLGRGIIMDLAEEAGALYKVDRSYSGERETKKIECRGVGDQIHWG